MQSNIRTAMTAAGIVVAAATLPAGLANADPERLDGVYQEQKGGQCNNKNSCLLEFTEVAAPQRITNVSCNISSQGNFANLRAVILGKDDASTVKKKFTDGVYLAPVTQLSNSFELKWQVLSQTLYVVPGSHYPAIRVDFDGDTTTQVFCQISGPDNQSQG
jgi:hypothetical protein